MPETASEGERIRRRGAPLQTGDLPDPDGDAFVVLARRDPVEDATFPAAASARGEPTCSPLLTETGPIGAGAVMSFARSAEAWFCLRAAHDQTSKNLLRRRSDSRKRRVE
jgi:hypothetical protein